MSSAARDDEDGAASTNARNKAKRVLRIGFSLMAREGAAALS
jgi:hypothetical protein